MSDRGQQGATPGATRSQHVVLQGPSDPRTMLAAMRAGIERSRDAGAESAPACVLIAPTGEQARLAAEQARSLLGDGSGRVVPVSDITRARRVLAMAPVAVASGTATELLQLRRAAALRFDALTTLVIIGLDEIIAAEGAETLTALLGDVPSGVARVATIELETEAAGVFLEAQLHRARRVSALPANGASPAGALHYIPTPASGRTAVLQQLLDEVDPPSCAILVSADAGESAVRDALRQLGLPTDSEAVRISRGDLAPHLALLVLWELPGTMEALAAALAANPVRTVLFVRPEELTAVQLLTQGTATPWIPARRRATGNRRVDAMRSALSHALREESARATELALLAPLLETHDPIELACAALRLWESMRQAKASPRLSPAEWAALIEARGTAEGTAEAEAVGDESVRAPRRESSPASAPLTGRQRIFLSAGTRDGARPGDFVGAIANEAGIPGDRIGQIDLYESHAIVELDAGDVTKVLEALEGVEVRGRRLNARLDVGRPARDGGRSSDRSEGRGRPSRGEGRGESRGASRGGPRGAARGDAPRGGARGGPRSESRGEYRGAARSAGARPSAPRSAAPRSEGARSEGTRGSAPRAGTPRTGASRGGPGARSGSGRPPRTSDERQAFGDRPVRERAEPRREWADRGDRLKNAKRPARRPSDES